jgi:hypothetical protein
MNSDIKKFWEDQGYHIKALHIYARNETVYRVSDLKSKWFIIMIGDKYCFDENVSTELANHSLIFSEEEALRFIKLKTFW